MDERTREGLNFLLTSGLVLALLALFSTLMFPSWLHSHVVFVGVVVVAALGVTYRLVTDGVLAEWGLEPLPPRPEAYAADGGTATSGSGVEGKTPKERFETEE